MLNLRCGAVCMIHDQHCCRDFFTADHIDGDKMDVEQSMANRLASTVTFCIAVAWTVGFSLN